MSNLPIVKTDKLAISKAIERMLDQIEEYRQAEPPSTITIRKIEGRIVAFGTMKVHLVASSD